MPKRGSVSRRTFLERGASTAAVTLVARHVLGGPRHVPPSDRINVGYVGIGTQGMRLLMPALHRDDLRIVAVCDPNRRERELRGVVPLRAARQGARVPGRPRLGRGLPGLSVRARGRPRDRGPSLRGGARRGLPRLRGLPGDAGPGEGPRRGLRHDARPPPRHGRARRDEGRQARHHPQAALQRAARSAPRHRDGAADRRGHPHVLRRRAAGDRAARASGSGAAPSGRSARCTTGRRARSGRRA